MLLHFFQGMIAVGTMAAWLAAYYYGGDE